MTDAYKDQLKQFGFIGHTDQIAKLTKIASNKAAHDRACFLFAGPEGSGKLLAARWFASQISDEPCTELAWTGKENLEQFYELFRDSGYGSRNKNRVRAYIIDVQKPLTMLISNALLKSLEEVNPNTTFILVVPDASYLIATIGSRAKPVYFNALSAFDTQWVLMNKLKFSQEKSDNLRLCFGSNLKLATSMEYDTIAEAKDWLYEKFQEISSSPYMFVEIIEVASWFGEEETFEQYRSIFLNWAKPYLADETYGPGFSKLCAELLNLKADLPNLKLWIQRAFIRYVGWTMPPIKTLGYETVA